MRINKFEWTVILSMLAIIFTIVSIVIMFWFMFSGYQDCSNEGGVYARTLFWYTCIK
jgi:flagellar basal body-associated protein FliL